MTTQVHDSYLPIYIVLACCLVCVVTLTCLAVLEIIEQARSDRLRREAMGRYWRSGCEALPQPSEWPCTADRRCMASHHDPSCPIRIAEMLAAGRKK